MDPSLVALEVYALPMARYLVFVAVLLTIWRGVLATVRKVIAGERRVAYLVRPMIAAFFMVGAGVYYGAVLFLEEPSLRPSRWDVVIINLCIAGYLYADSWPFRRRIAD